MIELIKKLRNETGAPLAHIKQALEQAKGDELAARTLLRKFGKAAVARKASREVKAGLVEAFNHLGKIGVVVEVGCETDFVARTADFKDIVHKLAMHVAAANPADVEELMAQPLVHDDSKTVADLLAEATATLGEKLVVSRFSRIELGR